MSPHAALAPYREWVAAGAVGPDPIEAANGGHCPPVARLPIFALSADLECAHGRVPIEGCEHDCHQPTPVWKPDWLKSKGTPDLMTRLTVESLDPRNGRPAVIERKRKPAPVPPVLAAVISDLNSEINRLTEARDRLEGVAKLRMAA